MRLAALLAVLAGVAVALQANLAAAAQKMLGVAMPVVSQAQTPYGSLSKEDYEEQGSA